MIRTAAAVGFALLASSGVVARAQSPAPRSYVLKAEGMIFDRKMTVTIVRDGARERIERGIEKSVTTTLYDFDAHRVYWIGWSGPRSCSSGRYVSARAPVNEDPLTGTAENLAMLTEGRSRKAVGTDSVAGRAARIEAFVGGKRPAELSEPWPTRVWLDEEGGFLLKLEGEGPKGRPVTMLEVKQLTFGAPPGALLRPPAHCTSTDAEMDDGGVLRAHAEGSVDAQASGRADLGSGATSGTATASGSPARPGPLAKISALTLAAAEQPHPGPCGTALRLAAAITVDGPATVSYKFQADVGGVQFSDGPIGTVTLDAAGSATLVKDAILPRSLEGRLRIQAIVQGTKGHNGTLKNSDPVPFKVTCAGR